MTNAEVVQWRNIKSAVRQLADFCFGSKDDPKWGTAWISVVNSLTASDGIGHDLKLEPLPNQSAGIAVDRITYLLQDIISSVNNLDCSVEQAAKDLLVCLVNEGNFRSVDNLDLGVPLGRYVVVDNATGEFMAIDSQSGGYPWWRKEIAGAEVFQADERAVDYISRSTDNRDVSIHEIVLGTPRLTLKKFEEKAAGKIREAALAKLSAVERRALGLE